VSEKIDFTEDKEIEASKDTLKQISALTEERQNLSNLMLDHQKYVTELKERITIIDAESIPALMDQCGLKEYSMSDGTIVSIKEILAASIPSITGINKAKGEQREQLKERRVEALGWLRSNGGGSIIKNEFIFSLGKDSKNEVLELQSFADEIKLPWICDESVHAGSLKTFLSEKIEKGDDVPFQTFGVYTGKIAKITQLKK
jgi:hypothetical protein